MFVQCLAKRAATTYLEWRGGIKHQNSCGCMNTAVSDLQLRIFSIFSV